MNDRRRLDVNSVLVSAGLDALSRRLSRAVAAARSGSTVHRTTSRSLCRRVRSWAAEKEYEFGCGVAGRGPAVDTRAAMDAIQWYIPRRSDSDTAARNKALLLHRELAALRHPWAEELYVILES